MAGEPSNQPGIFKVPSLPPRKADEYPALNYTPPSNASQPQHQFTLDVIKDGTLMDTYSIPSERSYSTFGRLPICDYSMDHVSISRYHAVLQFTTDQVLPSVVDLDSSHGTFINKQKINGREPQTLKIGDQIRFGASSRIWILSSTDPLESPTENVGTRDHEAIKIAKYQGDPVKHLKAVLREIHHEYCPERPAKDTNDHDTHQISVRIGLPLADDSGNTIYGTGQASSQSEAEKLACVHALEELDKHGYLDIQKSHKPLDDDDFYDQTKPTPQNDVETFDTLSHKLRLANEDIDRVQGELDALLQSNEEEEKDDDDDDDDELDAYMNTLARGEKADSKKKLAVELERLVVHRTRLDALLKIVAPDTIDAAPSPLKPASASAASVSTAPVGAATVATVATKPTTQSAKRRVVHSLPREDASENAPLAKHAKTSIDNDTTVSWQPPSNQSGDGRTSLNDKYGY
ncbi:hypothetical protein GGI13_001718 [Coemansia sp. RSA 455]|nr:hypothetical protein LPJ71_005614 [Coemansia sp. S17]KAJ2027026.1 hypothetical protein H4S03_008424 [Coemansia sp. S3946]KAJ2097269.1 hypothetical protein GGI09_003926 [Coemansia sp. S100]KAJ2255233.1 hypothetical protein GGI13_001718 [Coemansia sp. RSA 455]KAJ2459302.1 hypothetical protein GGI03_005586 [Coemansia sp. RSA 2337]